MTATTAHRHVLIAVIGTSDIKVPPAVADPDSREARAIGRALIQRLAERGAVEYSAELVPKYLDFLAGRGQHPDQVLLIATDQPESEPRRGQDTVFFAELVQRDLVAARGFDAGTVRIVRYTASPADYGETFSFFRQFCAALRREAAGATTYHLALTGGTPALTAALLSEGVSIFGDAEVIYLDRGAIEARAPQVALDLRAQALRRALRTHVDAHGYAAALALCRREEAVFDALLPDASRRDLVRALLAHAAERLNANQAGACEALSRIVASDLLPEEYAAIALPQATSAEAIDAQTIREVIASAEVMYGLAHYFDFITRVGTFMDTYGKYVAQHIFGAQPSPVPKSRDKITLEPWIQQQPDLCTYLVTEKSAPI